MPLRLSKTVFLAIIGFFFLLVVFNNTTDYWSNFHFVQHVLSMDTTFPGNNGMWRAITSPWLHHAFYISIILGEALAAFLCLRGALALFVTRNDPASFQAQKHWGIYGLTLGIVLWFVGFIAVGGEWFLMWQSTEWNGIEAAFRIITICGIALVLLSLPEQKE